MVWSPPKIVLEGKTSFAMRFDGSAGGLSNIVKRKHIRSWSVPFSIFLEYALDRNLISSDLLVMWAPLDRSALGCVRSK